MWHMTHKRHRSFEDDISGFYVSPKSCTASKEISTDWRNGLWGVSLSSIRGTTKSCIWGGAAPCANIAGKQVCLKGLRVLVAPKLSMSRECVRVAKTVGAVLSCMSSATSRSWWVSFPATTQHWWDCIWSMLCPALHFSVQDRRWREAKKWAQKLLRGSSICLTRKGWESWNYSAWKRRLGEEAL